MYQKSKSVQGEELFIEGILLTVLEIRVNPKKNAPKDSKVPKFAFGNFILILKIFLKLDDVQLRKLSICKNLHNKKSDFYGNWPLKKLL